MTRLHLYVFSARGLGIADLLLQGLRQNPWPDRQTVVELYAPKALLQRRQYKQAKSYELLASALAVSWQEAASLIFIGAAGIAVRGIAPFLRHKSCDPAVVVLDPAGQYAISLLSGHWGGANSLARHIARQINAQPVLTTASDADNQFALDLALQQCGLKIVDWGALPRLQALLLEGQKLALYDPWRILPEYACLERKTSLLLKPGEPCAAIDWRKQRPAPNLLRVALPILYVGIGCRKGISVFKLQSALRELLNKLDAEELAIASFATVTEKLQETAMQALAETYNLPLEGYTAEELARVETPNPSMACARRFAVKPFSVCEAAAISAAKKAGHRAFLLLPKQRINASMTFAIAIAMPGQKQCQPRFL